MTETEKKHRMNHNLAILALLLAMAGVLFATYGPWLILPSLVAAAFARRAILREPERYTGMLFVYASLALNGVLLVLFALLYLG
ncbi:hypothetical protein [Marinospirillum alkaliphilum]|uniref:Uncharacterized protein n=1 Tax=Marinospirillum alkaliphilum DSM 21637 TaxID=1122209 RepID=A0A1K1YZT5_9GAMM|nr:hypothetical protein [Marinospirillum alkaliphilum]SFX66955.1 hypothetical protein SAMN02745752_02473 [Marinospirillum alkaliphilum DSM 21637]